jgi:hypothetical protein
VLPRMTTTSRGSEVMTGTVRVEVDFTSRCLVGSVCHRASEQLTIGALSE